MRSLRSYFFTTLLRVVVKRQTPGAVPLEKHRQQFVGMMARLHKPQPGVTCQAGELGGVAGEWSHLDAYDGQRTLLYFHGGGYILGSAEAYRDLSGRLAVAAQANVFAADYRLAPEHLFPAALEDAMACYRALIAEGIPPESITIGGDSAGGGLALATLIALRDAQDPLPAAAICLSPWSDLTASGASLVSNAKPDPMLTPAALEFMAEKYIGADSDVDRADPRLSPCLGDLSGLPPMLVQVGSGEILIDDSRRVVDKITASGGTATLEVWDGMPHVWQMFAPLVPEGPQAIAKLGEFIRAQTPD